MSIWQDYLSAGWRLCSIRPGSKGPRTKGWDEGTAPFPPEALGAGLVHAFSGTCAIDFDDLERCIEFLARYQIDANELLRAPGAVQISSGRPNRAKLLYRIDKPLPSVKIADYEVTDPETNKVRKAHALELRCGTREGKSVQDVLPPTIHPVTGKPYVWIYSDDVLGHWSNLPPLPAALEALWRAELGPATTVLAETPIPKGAASAEILAILKQFDPNSDYDTWRTVGMALHHETKGSQDGLHIWNAWSSQATRQKFDGTGPVYEGLGALAAKWRTFKADKDNAVTLGSLRREMISEPEAFPEAPPEPAAPKIIVPEGTIRTLYDLGQAICYVHKADTYVDLRTMLEYRSPGHLARAFTPELEPDPATDKKPNIENYVVTRRDALQDAHSFGFHPGEPRIYKAGAQILLNNYTPNFAEPLEPPQRVKEAYEFLWGRIHDTGYREWLRQFYAFALKYPGRKIRSAPLLVSGTTGTGKSTLMSTVPKLLFGHVEEFSTTDLQQPFNGKLAENWWVTFEEICVGNGKAERRQHADKIKVWITNNRMTIRPMYKPSYSIENHVQFTASSNHVDDALQIDSDDERRWGVAAVDETQLTAAQCVELFDGPDAPFGETAKARQWLTWWVSQADLSDFNPDASPPVTEAKNRMHRGSLGEWESEIVRMIVKGTSPFDRDVVTTDQIRDAFVGRPPAENYLGSFLKSALGCKSVRVENRRAWSWRNHAFWARTNSQYIRKHMETGERRADLSNEIPKKIRNKSADLADIDSDPNSDLL